MDMNDRVAEALRDTEVWFPGLEPSFQTLPFFLLCLGGEVGELQNKAKKWMRGDLSWEEACPLMADELVDGFVYAYCVAKALDINLEEEYDRKRRFNDERFNQLQGARTDP